MQQRARGRMEWIDAAKGVGIILVVIGHVWTRGAVRDLIYAFHMPLFFLLSGYTLAPRPMRETLVRMLRSMAVPYAAFLILLALWDAGFESWRGARPIFRDWGDALWRMGVGGSELRGPFTIFWFVPALFFARIAYNALAQIWPDPRDIRWLAIVAALWAGGVYIGARTDFSPLGLLSVPVVVALLWVGARWRAMRSDRWMMAAMLVAGPVLALMLVVAGAPPLNMKVGEYGWPVVGLLCAIVLSLGLCAWARSVPPAMLAALGRMSLVIMYLHVAVIHYLAPYMGKWMLAPLALGVPVAVALVMERFTLTRRLFLGQG